MWRQLGTENYDVKQDEPFIAEDAEYNFGPVQVPPGKVLVLGDSCNHSLGGHIFEYGVSYQKKI